MRPPDPDDILFPALDPYDHGWLQVSAQHSIYFEQCGNPDGAPAVVLHGGPGSGCAPAQRRFFDPAHYRIILFDQRGCKRSLPLGRIEENTTRHLVDDLEMLRTHLAIERWMVFGGSWGSTLALHYAITCPQSLSSMILRGIFLCRPDELDWFLHRVRHFFPEAWEAFVAPLSFSERDDILHAYQSRIFSDNETTALSYAIRWSHFESAIMSLMPANEISVAVDDDIIIARARVQLHYLLHGGFIDGGTVLEKIDRIRHLPAIIVQGRYDMVCPPLTAHELHQAWPEAQFSIIPDAGHSAMEPGIAAALVAATESFKRHALPKVPLHSHGNQSC